MSNNFRRGDVVKVPFGSRILTVIVIDPHGLAPGQPSIGMGLRHMSKQGGIPHNTLSDWVVEIKDQMLLKVPSGKLFRVVEILGSDGNSYTVIEAADWMSLTADVAKNPGKVRKSTINKAIDFMAWFAIDGFYAQSYSMLGLVYGQRTQHALHQWKESRGLGIPNRKQYTSYLDDLGEVKRIGTWTDTVYMGLFGYRAKQMIRIWDTQAGYCKIARNHIPEAIGLQAVAYCERLVVTLDLPDLGECHTVAINITIKKFGLNDNDCDAA